MNNRMRGLRNYEALVAKLRDKPDRTAEEHAVLRKHEATLQTICQGCACVIDPEDVDETVDGRRYHLGCEPSQFSRTS